VLSAATQLLKDHDLELAVDSLQQCSRIAFQFPNSSLLAMAIV
jgi:hypothetical protein